MPAWGSGFKQLWALNSPKNLMISPARKQEKWAHRSYSTCLWPPFHITVPALELRALTGLATTLDAWMIVILDFAFVGLYFSIKRIWAWDLRASFSEEHQPWFGMWSKSLLVILPIRHSSPLCPLSSCQISRERCHSKIWEPHQLWGLICFADILHCPLVCRRCTPRPPVDVWNDS